MPAADGGVPTHLTFAIKVKCVYNYKGYLNRHDRGLPEDVFYFEHKIETKAVRQYALQRTESAFGAAGGFSLESIEHSQNNQNEDPQFFHSSLTMTNDNISMSQRTSVDSYTYSTCGERNCGQRMWRWFFTCKFLTLYLVYRQCVQHGKFYFISLLIWCKKTTRTNWPKSIGYKTVVYG